MIGSTLSNVGLLVFAAVVAIASVHAWWSIRGEESA